MPKALQRPPRASASWGPVCCCFSEMSSPAAVLSFVASPPGRLGTRLPVQLTAGRLCDVCPATWGGVWGVLTQWGASCDAHLLGAFLGLIGKVARLRESRQGEEGCGPAADLPLYLF